MQQAFLLTNVSTAARTKALRRDSSTRTKLVHFDNAALRLMPHRPHRVSLEWLELHRAEVCDYQRRGLLRVATQENVELHLPLEGEIPYPTKAPTPVPRPPEELPPELRGELLFDAKNPANPEDYPKRKGWSIRHPSEAEAQRAPSSLTGADTPLLAFPAELQANDASAEEELPPPAPVVELTSEEDADLADLLASPSAVPWDLPADMVLQEGTTDDDPVVSEPPASPEVVDAKPPAPGGKRGRRRR